MNRQRECLSLASMSVRPFAPLTAPDHRRQVPPLQGLSPDNLRWRAHPAGQKLENSRSSSPPIVFLETKTTQGPKKSGRLRMTIIYTWLCMHGYAKLDLPTWLTHAGRQSGPPPWLSKPLRSPRDTTSVSARQEFQAKATSECRCSPGATNSVWIWNRSDK